MPDDVTTEQVLIELNTDFSNKGLASQNIQAIVGAWQAGAISRDTMTELFRRGEVLPEGRSTEEEEKLIAEGATPPTRKQMLVINSDSAESGWVFQQGLGRRWMTGALHPNSCWGG